MSRSSHLATSRLRHLVDGSWTHSFIADGAPLEVRLTGAWDTALSSRLARVLQGYEPTSRSARAALEITAGRDQFTITESGPSTEGSPSLLDPELLHIGNPDHLPLALDEWVTSASLWFGTPTGPRLHAACFVLRGRAWVVAGRSGSGKSSLALESLLDGGRHGSDERTTVVDGLVRGLARPLRLRLPENELVDRTAGRFVVDRDAARSLIPFDMVDRPGCFTTEWVVPHELVVLDETPPAEPTRGWAIRKLVELSMNSSELGVAGLVEIARLVTICTVRVVPPRRYRRITDLPPPQLAPIPGGPVLVAPGPEVDGSTLGPRTGVGTVALQNECLIWVPGPPAHVVALRDAGARAWLDLLHDGGRSAHPGLRPFLDSLVDAGALEGRE